MNAQSIAVATALTLALMASVVTAQTDVPGGAVSGSWAAIGSPYHVYGEIRVEAGDTLRIGPGVSVVFMVNEGLKVFGTLEAVGVASDSVRFNSSGSWTGVTFESGADAGAMEYCYLTGRAYPLLKIKSNPTVARCSFRHGRLGVYVKDVAATMTLSDCRFYGNDPYGGVECGDDTSVTIINCLFKDNFNGGMGGGGVTSEHGALTLRSCVFEGNEADNTAYGFAGAVSSYGSTVDICDCTFVDNRCGYTFSVTGGGGAIGLRYATGTISGCVMHGNSSVRNGSSLYVGIHSTAAIDRCTFDCGNSNYDLADICVQQGCTANFTNCIMTDHGMWSTSAIDNYGTLSVEYCDFFGNTGNILGGAPAGFGELVETNGNGDASDVFGNIFMDPLYVGSTSGTCWDLHLRAESPCIDAGDPEHPLDSDGTAVDMGALWFDQRRPDIVVSPTAIDFGEVVIGSETEGTLAIRNAGMADLVIHSVPCEPTCFASDFVPADSLVAPGDSLLLTIAFAPSDTGAVFGTLSIVSNDEPATVELSGSGGFGTGVPGTPKMLALAGPWPNPSRRSASFELTLPQPAHVRVEVFDLSGRRVAVFLDGRRDAGVHDMDMDLTGLASGTYFYRCSIDGEYATGKLSVLR